jgi:hypothetical protein
MAHPSSVAAVVPPVDLCRLRIGRSRARTSSRISRAGRGGRAEARLPPGPASISACEVFTSCNGTYALPAGEGASHTPTMHDRPTAEWRKLVQGALAEIHGYEPSLRDVLAAKGIPSSASPLRDPAAVRRKRSGTPLKLVGR